MIVADTSALISLGSINILGTVLNEFDVHTTETVVRELENTAEYDDVAGEASEEVLERLNRLTVHTVEVLGIDSSRIDTGEESCISLAREIEADFLLTDDFKALPEIEAMVDAQVAVSPLVLKALVKRGELEGRKAEEKLDQIAERRNWLDAPIYRRAKRLFE